MLYSDVILRINIKLKSNLSLISFLDLNKTAAAKNTKQSYLLWNKDAILSVNAPALGANSTESDKTESSSQ